MADRHNRDIERQQAPLPAPLPVPTVDSHAHLEIVTNDAADSDAVRTILDDAKSVNVDRIVQVGYSAEQSQWCVDLANNYPGRVLATVALHPNEAPIVEDMEHDWAIIEKLAQEPRVRAIGETGLVYFRTPPELREAVKLVPSDQLLVETDSPFLAPAPHRGALNTPAQIANIVRAMATERGEDVAQLATALSLNAERIFGSFA